MGILDEAGKEETVFVYFRLLNDYRTFGKAPAEIDVTDSDEKGA